MTEIRSVGIDDVCLSVVTPAPAAGWARAAAADPDHLPSHTEGWTRAIEDSSGMHDVSRLYQFGDGREFVLPLVARSVAGRPLAAWSFPSAWGIGGVVGPDFDVGVARAIIGNLSSSRLHYIAVRTNPAHRAVWAQVDTSAATVKMRHAHVVTLAGSCDDLFETTLTSKARRCVRKARKSGVEVECDTTGGLLGDYFRLYELSVARWAEQTKEPKWLAWQRARRRDSERKMAAWFGRLEGAATMWVARHEGRAVAALIVLNGADAHYTRGVMDRELANPLRANDLLHWSAIEAAHQSGARRYHMGDTNPGSGLARFKEQLGAACISYPELRFERFPFTRIDRLARNAVKRAIRYQDV